MRDEFKEQLSAMADDELSAEELQFLTRRLSSDAEAIDQLGRYHLLSDALRGNYVPGGGQLAQRVSAALDDEPALRGERGGGRFSGLLRPVAGMAVAASVALVMVSLWPQRDGEPVASSTQAAADAPASPSSQVVADGSSPGSVREQPVSVTTSDGQWQTLDPEVQRRLNTYLVNHSEHSSTGRFGGVLTYVRIAGHEGQQ